MTSEDQNFELYAGDSKDIVVTVTDSNGAAVNLTNFTIFWKLTLLPTSSTALISKAVGTGIVKTNPSGGIFTVTITNTDTATLAGCYYHEAKIVDGSSNEFTVTSGRAIIHSSVV